MTCLFVYWFIFVSAYTNSSANGPDRPSVIRKLTDKSGAVATTQHFLIAFNETPCCPAAGSDCLCQLLLLHFVFISGLHIRDFSLKLRLVQLPRCGCQSCLLAIRRRCKHSKPHNSVLHSGSCHVRYARPPATAQHCRVSTQRRMWCEKAIRTPVRQSDTWS